jgi:two-component system, sensor histidine kinase and response regulator
MTKKILLIEDDPMILEQTVSILQIEGFEATGVDNGVSGLQVAQEYLPDLIISDISMPGMDGRQVLLEIRSNPRTAAIPFIFLTAQSEMTNLRRGMELGADDYVTKPFAVPDLIAAVNTRLERRSEMIHEQEKRMEELRSNLIYMLPHELRTPLASILGYADFLLENIDDIETQKVKEMLKSLRRGGERLHQLVENYLLYAQIEILRADPTELERLREKSIQNPRYLIQERAQYLASRAKRPADLVLEMKDADAVHILEDSLIKIVNELVDNAFKFSKPGSKVVISSAVEDDSFVFEVKDQGCGMSTLQLQNIGAYMQFQRKLYEQQGLGLGLSIANGLVTLFNGALDIQSDIDQGTIVKVYLPLASKEA